MITLGVTGGVWKAKVVAMGLDWLLELWKVTEIVRNGIQGGAKSYLCDQSYDEIFVS